MTAQRRQQRHVTRFAACSAAIFGCVLAATLALQVHAATTERVVTDRHTGLAISGFDPVAYFTDAVPRLGLVGSSNSHHRASPGASAMKAIWRPSPPTLRSTLRNSAATIRSVSRAVSRPPAIRKSSAHSRQAALSVPVRGNARAFHRRSRRGSLVGAGEMAGRATRSHSLIVICCRADASPQAMKAGTR